MSLLKTNEIQNYNGSSLTLTASTVSTSAQLNTGGNISVTGSLNVSDDSTTRTNLGLGTIATQDADSIAVTGGTATLGALTVSGSDSGDLVRITQTGSGNALVVEDSANPDSTPFVVTHDGKVGIGTSSPNATLEIGGTATPTIRLQENGGGAKRLELSIDSSSVGRIGANQSAQALAFDTVGTERMRIDSSGNVGIGTSSPNGKLHLKEATNLSESAPHIRIEGNAYTGFHWLDGTAYYIGQNSPYRSLRLYSGGATTAGVNLAAGGTSWGTFSDERLKYDIEPITDGLTKLANVRCVSYRLKDVDAEDSKKKIGVIAQDLVGLIDEVIDTTKRSGDDTEYMSIRYTELIPVLVKAIQEQQELIESQQSKIDALTTKTQEQDLTIASLISRIEALETPAE